MAFVCFKCKRLIQGDLKCLFSHLRIIHNVNSSTTYFQCCQSSCNRTFSFIRSYRRHLHSEHVEYQAPVQPANVPNQAANVDNADKMAQVEGEQADEWDELAQEGITDRVALFLAYLRSRSSQTFSNINHVVQQTSSLIGDIVGRLKTKTMSLFSHFGHDQIPQVQELWQEFSDAAEPFKGLETDYKQLKYFTNSGNFIQPVEEFFPGVSYVQHRDSATGSVRQLAVTDSYQRIPLKPLLVKI